MKEIKTSLHLPETKKNEDLQIFMTENHNK